MTISGLCTAQICGCTDPFAINYDSNATVNDGGCVYSSTIISATDVGPLDTILNNTSALFYWQHNYWTCNDRYDNCLYCLDSTNAAIIETLCIDEIDNYDIEEVAQDSLYLYLGDVGNNVGTRQDLHILRIKKESLLNRTIEVDTIWYSYEDQTDFSFHLKSSDFDCEAFIIASDSIYLFTKQWASEQTTFYGLPKTPGTYIAHRHETYNVQGLITGASYLSDYQLLVLCGYDYNGGSYAFALHPFIFLLYDFQGEDFFSGNKRRLDFPTYSKSQIEAIATSNALDYYLTNEQFSTTVMGMNVDLPAKLHRVNLRAYLFPYLNKFGLYDNPNNLQNLHNAASDFHLYPNPATDRLNIDFPQDFNGAEYKIFNLNGQLMMEGVLKDNIIYLNNRNLYTGNYILVLRKDEEIKTFCFIKKEE